MTAWDNVNQAPVGCDLANNSRWRDCAQRCAVRRCIFRLQPPSSYVINKLNELRRNRLFQGAAVGSATGHKHAANDQRSRAIRKSGRNAIRPELRAARRFAAICTPPRRAVWRGQFPCLRGSPRWFSQPRRISGAPISNVRSPCQGTTVLRPCSFRNACRS
jgi:hypothetical protein